MTSATKKRAFNYAVIAGVIAVLLWIAIQGLG